MNTSYGNRKTFFFSDVPSVGEYASNMDSLPVKTTAIKVNLTEDLIEGKHIKVRSKDDMAITFDGDYSLSNGGYSQEYYILKQNGNQLVYENVSKDVYDNYTRTYEGKVIQDLVSNPEVIERIKHDFYYSLANTKYGSGSNLKLFKN